MQVVIGLQVAVTWKILSLASRRPSRLAGVR
jgi:hypothetical protein